MKIGNREFDTKNGVYIMGILNVTPDSFSDGGQHNTMDSAMRQAETMINEGASIIDVGGESTRPNYTQISVQEEIDRVSEVITKIKAEFDIPVSLDTYKSEVFKALSGEIDMLNDIWGLKYDGTMAKALAESGLPCCLMHNRRRDDYTDFWADFMADMKECISIAREAGITEDKIILDGGVGFQKTYEQNLTVIKNTELLCALGLPVMVATSRKSVIAQTLDKPPMDRAFGTAATTVIGVMKGAGFVRVHEVGANLDAIKMTKSIFEERKWIG